MPKIIETVELDLEKLRGAFTKIKPRKNGDRKGIVDFSLWNGKSSYWMTSRFREGMTITLEDLNSICRYLGRNSSEFLIFHQETVPDDFCPADGRTEVHRNPGMKRALKETVTV